MVAEGKGEGTVCRSGRLVGGYLEVGVGIVSVCMHAMYVCCMLCCNMQGTKGQGEDLKG